MLCLIQVATDTSRLAVVDPLKVGDLKPFWDAVVDPSIEVVMHAAGEDLRICRLQTGTLPRGFSTSRSPPGWSGSATRFPWETWSTRSLRVSLLGGETRTDWRRRPLSEAQLRYALEDVRHLLELADLAGRESCEELGRVEWAEAEFADFLGGIEHRAEEERWRKLSGLHMLNRRGLEVARRLSEWRSPSDARRSNRPLRSVLRDDLLVAIAKRQPANRRDLEALRDFNRPHLLGKAGEILAVIAEAQAVAPESLPEPAERHDDLPGLAMVVSLLSATLSQACAQGRVAVGLAGGASDLKEVVRWYLDGQPSRQTPDLLKGWRDPKSSGGPCSKCSPAGGP